MHLDLRARALLRVLPALVHRLRNALVVVQGACELGAGNPVGAHAQEKLALLNEGLERLSVLAREPGRTPQVLAAETLVRNLAVLLGPLERSGIEVRLACEGSGAIADDGWLEPLLLDACTALLEGMPGGRRRLRLVARATPLGLRLSVVVLGAPGGAALLVPLRAHAAQRGWPWIEHVGLRATALRFLLPLLPGARPEAPRALSRGRPLLLVHSGAEERELMAAVLAERGHHVVTSAGVPESGGFALALLERRLVEAEPGLPERVRRLLGLEHVEIVDPLIGPDALLALVSRRS